MSTAGIVFRKELRDAFRDRRTLMAMVVIPLLMFPILIGISSKFMTRAAKEARERTLRIGFVANNSAADLRELLRAADGVRIIESLSEEEATAMVQADSLDALIVVNADFDGRVADMGVGRVDYYFKRTDESRIERRRVRQILDEFERELRGKRFAALGLDPAIVETVEVEEHNLASAKEQIADAIGGLLPYLFIIFCYTGSMYAAIDLAAGEKERGTLETLFTSPASRFSILIGKFGVVVLTGLLSAGMSMVGMYAGVRMSTDLPAELMNTVTTVLSFDTIALLLSMLVPLTVFFAAILLSLSIFSKTYKEAQSIVSPLMMAVIVPAFMGLLPGVKLSATTALIPIMNVTLATKQILAGNVQPALLAITYLSLVVFALLGIFACSKVFERESTLFRGI